MVWSWASVIPLFLWVASGALRILDIELVQDAAMKKE